ncbi:MAG: glycosyltransferase family 4 protein [Planctomycetota bacterium]
MRICHVITRLIIGGAQENTVLTCRGLAERGHEVTLIAGPETGPEGSLWDKAEAAGCKLVRVEALRRAVRPFSDWRAARELRRLFRQLRPDVVHAHSSKAGILGRWAAARAGVPVVVHTIHGMSFNRTQGRITQITYRCLEKKAAQWTTKFVAVADAMIDQAVEAGIAPRERFVTIRSGMETDQFTPNRDLRRRHRQEWGVNDGDVVVGTIARLFANKGYEEIMAAMPSAIARDPRLRFVWIGDGAYRARYERRLEAMGLRDRVRMLGLVRPDEAAFCINGFDIILHASRWEGLPRAVVQGLLTEVPAVSFDNDGAPEVVRSGETGILVPFGDISGLSDALLRLAEDAELRRSLGRRGRELCRTAFDWHNMVESLESLYGELLQARAAPVAQVDRASDF